MSARRMPLPIDPEAYLRQPENRISIKPPFVVSPELSRLLKRPGLLKGKDGERVREIYQEGAFFFSPVRDLSIFGTYCAFGLFDAAVKEYHATKPDLTATETAYQWGYVSITASRSWYMTNAQPLSVLSAHAKVLEFLVSQGAPIDLPDIAGLTALHHVAMNNYRGEVLKFLLENGANPNARDRYGCSPIFDAMKHGQAEAFDMCLQYGADLDLRENDGYTARRLAKMAGPTIDAVVQRHLRKKEGKPAHLEDKNRCTHCGSDGCRNQCSRCKTARYCNSDCQAKHWKAGHKHTCIPFDDSATSLVFTPTYDTIEELKNAVSYANHNALLRNYLGHDQDGESKRKAKITTKEKALGPKYKTKDGIYNYPPPSLLGRPIIIKVQVPARVSLGHNWPQEMLVYNKTRDLFCRIIDVDQPQAYAKLDAVIRQKGAAGGLKGYFIAEMESNTALKIKVGDILGEQPW
ncbi:SubName: Full=Uncharacterized protein {ECO:0000313/EMBL:CCA70279.1} [Serendipita indica DSM 11827]|nr:SubName: Full=Uncharacterized protein {ECO:0000313/EMBL:CCA70279.1} [Serendipita indica DSM 11827]